ncbi:RNA polymerase subunit sigma [Nostoc sp. 3335mG]|nr:RNA polymerase subunit sigma [Nostoc sp. 3335mG]
MKGGFFRPRLVFSAAKAAEVPRAPDQAERFRAVMLPHMDAAYTLARYLTRDPAAAEDIVQEAFLRAYRGFGDWRGEAPKAWLLAIVRNCFLNSVSTAAARARTQDIHDWQGDVPAQLIECDNPESLLADRSEAAMLRATIEQLPEPFRETLILRELEEMSYKDIATIAQVPIGTVMSRLSRARQMLADLLLPGDTKGARA